LAISPTLPPLEQAPNLHLVGFVAAYYLPQEDLAEELLVVDGAVVGELVLAAGAAWRKLPYTPHTLKLEETPKLERGVTTYQLRVTAQRPQPAPGVLAALEALDRRKLLLLLVEAGGGRRLLGNREEYLRLLTTTEGQHPGTRAGVELRFEGEATQRAPYYLGSAPLLSGGTVAAPPTAAGYVDILDAKGNLLLRVAAGKTVKVLSSFLVKLGVVQ
jgi:hypothetical protein